jgi:two-component system, NarL family, sensor kinase
VLAAAAAMAAGSEPLEPRLGHVAQLLTEHLRADGCIVYGIDEDAGELYATAVHPPTRLQSARLRLPLGFGVTGRVAADGISAVLIDDAPRNTLHRAILGLAEGQSVSRMCVPALSPDGRTWAVVAVHSRTRREFTAADVADASAVARVLGLRLQRDAALTDADEHRSAWEGLVAVTVSAQEAERRRVAADLHDGVTQAIASLAFHLSAAEVALADAGPSFALEQVEAARGLADLAFTEARTAISGLRSPVLDDLGLAAGLESLARSVPQLSVRVDATDLDLPEHVATALYRIAQESIQNAVKHSGASNVFVRLDRVDDAVLLVVGDDGHGFDTTQRAGLAANDLPRAAEPLPVQPRYGLVGMHERIQLLGGRLTVESEPGAGTTVRALVPLSSQGSGEDLA